MATNMFSPEDLNALVADTASLLKEQKEAASAQEAHDREIARLAQERVALNKGTMQLTEKAAQEAQVHLDSMDASLKQIDKINDSWGMRILEPLADGLKLKNYSRKELLRDVQTEQQALNNTLAKTEFEQQKLGVRQQELEARAAAADANLALETNQVVTLKDALNTQRVARADLESMQAGVIANADEATLAELERTGAISPQRAKEERRVRESQELQIQSQRRSAYMQELQVHEARLETLSDEQLRDPEATKGMPRQFVVDAQRRRAAQNMAQRQVELSLAATQRAIEEATLADKELTALAKSGKGASTEFSAEQEIATRKEAADLRKQRAARSLREQELQQREASALWLSHATVPQLVQLRDQAISSGVAIHKTEGGAEMKFALSEIQQKLDLEESVRMDLAVAVTSEGITRNALQNATDEFERVYGIPVDREAPLDQRLDRLIKNPDVPAEQRTALEVIQSRIRATDSNLDAKTKLMLQEQATVAMQKASEAARASVLETTAKGNQPGMNEYLTTGKIQTVEAGLPIISTSTVLKESTGSPIYDSALGVLFDKISTTKDQAKAQDLIAQLATKDLSPAELAAVQATDQGVQETMARGIVAAVTAEAHALAAESLGDRQLANDIRMGRIFKNNQFDERAIMTYLGSEKSQIKLPEYLERLRETSSVAGRTIMEPGGRQGHVIAALNKLLFNNQNEIYAQDFVISRWREAEQRTTEAASSPFSSGAVTAFPNLPF